MRRLCLLMSIFVLPLFARDNQATRFRGPNGQGIYENETAPIVWSDSNYKWIVDLPGSGNASPVLWNNTIFCVSAQQDPFLYIVLALNSANGSVLWRKEFPFAKYQIRKESSFATATPTVDEKHLYVVFASHKKTTVVALKHNGTIIWQREFDGVVSRHGFGASPILLNDKVFFTREQESVAESPFKSTWCALEKESGKNRRYDNNS